jgi:hypothetical protein
MFYLHVKVLAREENIMATRTDDQSGDAWMTDTSEELDEMDMDESELFFDDLDVEEDDEEEEEGERFTGSVDKYRSFSARRRIEIAREDRMLRCIIDDFDDIDFDRIENLDDVQVERFSY